MESVFRQSPIERRILNVSIQIRARKRSSSLSTSLIAHSQLYAFNCSYFTDCGQCLSRQLSGSCVWCAKNSKCIFASGNAAAAARQCPNEIDFYSRTSSSSKDLCTSFSIVKLEKSTATTPVVEQPLGGIKVDIPFSADSSLVQFTRLNVRNVKEYQKSFVCLFTKRASVIKNSQSRFSKSNFKW